jgi:hypothetical protein
MFSIGAFNILFYVWTLKTAIFVLRIGSLSVLLVTVVKWALYSVMVLGRLTRE